MLPSLRPNSVIVNCSGTLSRIFAVLFLFAIVGSPFASTQEKSKVVPSHRLSSAENREMSAILTPDLNSRLQLLTSAKGQNDPRAVASASRLLIALALRRMGTAELSSFPVAAIEDLKRARDFEDSSEARLDLAAAYLKAERTDEALSLVTDVLMADPNCAPAWYLQGKIWLVKLRFDEAVKSFTNALSQQKDPGASYLLGAALLRANRYKEGKAAFDALASNNKPATHKAFAVAYGAANCMEDSAREWRLAGLSPKSRNASTKDVLESARHVGSNFESPEFSAHQRERLKGELRTVLANALNDLATSEARQQRYQLALAHFHEAANWNANLPGLMRNTGIAAARLQKHEECIRVLTPVLVANPGDKIVRSILGTALYARGLYAEAVQVFTPLGDDALEPHELAYSWAASLVSIKEYAKAGKLLSKLEAQQLSPDTLSMIAQLWSQMGNYEHTVEICNRGAELDQHILGVHYLAGLALLRLNRAADASEAFRQELHLDPDNINAQFHLGFTLLQQSQNDEAIELWKKVLLSKPDHPEANYELGKELLIEGKAQESLSYLEAAVLLKPQFEPAHYQLQSAYRAVGRKDDADREAKTYRALKAKSRNIKLPPSREGVPQLVPSNK